jgi:hypothetical protein
VVWFAAMALGARARLARERTTERALAQAREALIAYAVDRPINAAVGPGYLPCPDLDGDGWAESTCGSLDGASGQAARLGMLPWKTLGLPPLRDGSGERLWYAVSTKYKGLLNCAESTACVDMTPAHAPGTISVRASDGSVIHDGARTTGAIAVVIAPGPPLERIEASGVRTQARACAPGDCDASEACITTPPQRAATCDPRNYLDRAPGAAWGDEDNADFVDRSDAAGRPLDTDGFVSGPVSLADGRVVVNDRVAVIAFEDLVPRIMSRVALEVAQCLRFYASRPENGARFPAPVSACARGERFGHLPDTPFDVGPGTMLTRWWRATPRVPESLAELPTHDDACRVALAPDDPGPVRSQRPGAPSGEGTTAPSPSWWAAWKPLVYVSVAAGRAPADAPGRDCAEAGGCVTLLDAGARVLRERQSAAVIVSPACPASDVCASASCSTLTVGTNPRALHAVVAIP